MEPIVLPFIVSALWLFICKMVVFLFKSDDGSDIDCVRAEENIPWKGILT